MNIKNLFRRLDFGVAFQRWPIASIISVILSLVLISWISQDQFSDQEMSTYARAVLSIYVGFLIAIVVPLAMSRYRNTAIRYVITVLIALGFMALWYNILPNDVSASYHETYWLVYTYPIQIVILHLLISVAGFWRRDANELGFRFWNIKLLKVVLEGLLFVAVLMLGLSLALMALEHLFGFDIDQKAYLYLAVLLLGIFHPWFVLSKTSIGSSAEEEPHHIEGFRILTQYILIPIVILYMVILYLYGVKILIEGSLPQGWLGKLSLGFCSVTALTYLINTHVKEYSQKKISHLFHRWTPLILILPITLLLIAIFRRIQDYGITEIRYLIAGIAICLLIISLAYSLNKTLSVRWIPAGLILALLFFLGSGPINIFNSSINSQEKRLASSMTEAGLMENGMLVERSDSSSTFIDLSPLRYLSNRMALKNLSLLNGDQVNWGDLEEDDDQYSFVVERFQLQENYVQDNTEYVYYQSEQLDLIDISNYDTAMPFNTSNSSEIQRAQLEQNQSLFIITLEDGSVIELESTELYSLHKKNKENQGSLPLIIERSSQLKISIQEYNIEVSKGTPIINHCSGILFYNSTK